MILNFAEISLYQRILDSGFFNPKWYVGTYHISEASIKNYEVSNSIPKRHDIQLVAHYMSEGWRKGYDPCQDFSTSCYLCDYTDIKNSGINPLDHYVTYGVNEGRVKQKHREWPKFSIIMATYNRKNMIVKSIDSALQQITEFAINYEIIVADDGSEDDTVNFLNRKYPLEIKNGIIKVISLEHKGVCAARNQAIKNSSYEWICYLDDDNVLSSDFIDTFSKEIIKNSRSSFFYAQHYIPKENRITEHEFNRAQLLKSNFIDLGSICHSKDIFNRVGGFDEKLTRLVDWDLIIKITGLTTPVYIPKIVMEYNSDQEYKRISNTEAIGKNFQIIQEKNKFELDMLHNFDYMADEIVKLKMIVQAQEEHKRLLENKLSQFDLKLHEEKKALEDYQQLLEKKLLQCSSKIQSEIKDLKNLQESKFKFLFSVISIIVSQTNLLKFKLLKTISIGKTRKKLS